MTRQPDVAVRAYLAHPVVGQFDVTLDVQKDVVEL